MTLHQLLIRAARLFPVDEHDTGWRVRGAAQVYSTRAAAYKAASRWRVERVLLERLQAQDGPDRVIQAACLAKRHTDNGGDWRDCARKALRELEGRTTRSDRRP